MKYYTGTLEECLVIDATISHNCSWPHNGTTNWDNPRETVNPGVYAIQVPQGSHGFTKEQMTTGIITQERDVQFPEDV